MGKEEGMNIGKDNSSKKARPSTGTCGMPKGPIANRASALANLALAYGPPARLSNAVALQILKGGLFLPMPLEAYPSQPACLACVRRLFPAFPESRF